MSSDPRPLGARLGWSLRTYGWMVLACALLGTAAPLLVTPEPPLYESDVLVIARDLPVDKTILPRLGEAVFDSGAVASAVAATPAVSVESGDLIPERLSVVAAEDSIVYVVQARDPQPMAAAEMADVAAAAFVEELNRGGTGVGEFAVQTQALVPTQPLDRLDRGWIVAAGTLAGAVLGLALVALLAALRRPVIAASDVEEAVGVPVVGTIELPAVGRAALSRRIQARGIAALARRVATVPPGRLLLRTPRSATAMGRSVFVLLAVALGLLRPVTLQAGRAVTELVQAGVDGRRTRLRAPSPGSAPAGELVLSDGDPAVEIVDPARTTLSVLAVVPRGISRRRLQNLVRDVGAEELVGVVLVDLRSTARRFGDWLVNLVAAGRTRASRASVPARDLQTEAT